MELGLEGMVALMTGASKGMGRAAALEMARAGARVVMVARGEGLEQAAKEVRSETGAEVLAIPADLTRPADVEALVTATLKSMGQIDVLYINVAGPATGAFLDLSMDDWRQGIELTILTAVRLCYAVVPHMLERGSGSIVANQSFVVKLPAERLMLSNALRLTVIGLVKSLANELGPKGIRVNSINPGWTRTERVDDIMDSRARTKGTSREVETEAITRTIPMGRMANVDEIGRAVAWLASPAASYVNGHALFVDGGLTPAAL
jgi:3-oxoacyl-[acyl-carrier protein] reductase